MEKLFVTGIDTNAGKTVIAAILAEALKADYWKPVQAGELHDTDTMKARALVSNTVSVFHPEAYRLNMPMSPHAAAARDGVTIDLDSILLPDTNNTLIIEGAGGLLVPLNDREFVIDLIKKLDAEVVLVSRHYLGSINHTLLSAGMLKQHGIKVRGIIFNGDEIEGTEAIILKHTGYKHLGTIGEEEVVDKEMVSKYAGELRNGLIILHKG
jgi:dethiobiotin synthetase